MAPATRAPLHILKGVVALCWLALFVTAVSFWWASDVPLADTPELLHARLAEFGLWRAGLIYVVLYTVRPLILFPATLLTVASGLVFGPWVGIAFTIVGENASANFAFRLVRWLGRDFVGAHETGRLRAWDDRIRANALVSVLIMRLVYLPFDVVNYGCGLTAMRQRDFAIGTFIGIMPGLISFVLLGGSASPGTERPVAILLGSLVFFLLGLAIARRLRERSPEAPAR